MDKDFKTLLENLERFDLEVKPKFWLEQRGKNHEMPFREWRDFVISSYDVVSDSYAKKVYESVVFDKETNSQKLVQLTLCDLLNKVEGSPYEPAARRAIMKCVHSGRKFDRELRSVMDAFYADV